MSGRKPVSSRSAFQDSPVSQFLSDPAILKLFDYWRAQRNGHVMPLRRDIDPIEIPWALSRLALMDYSPETGFHYRLAGQQIATVFGRSNLKGLSFRDLMAPAAAEMIEARWAPVVEQRCVVCMKGMVYMATDRTPIGERILLPLADDPDETVTAVLAMTVCEWLVSNVSLDIKAPQITYISATDIP